MRFIKTCFFTTLLSFGFSNTAYAQNADIHPGIQQLISSADAGDLQAQVIVAQLFFNGIGVPQSSEVSIAWLQVASEQGSEKATLLLKNISNDKNSENFQNSDKVRLTKPARLSPAERGLRDGIQLAISRRGAAAVNAQIRAVTDADSRERKDIIDLFLLADMPVPQELLKQMDMLTELRKRRAMFNAAAPEIAAQYTKQYNSEIMAKNELTLNANIETLTREVRAELLSRR